MSKDISPILAGWDHEPGELQVRIVPGDDGFEKLQMRIDLGLLQMEMDGRPDGRRPHGFESLLEYHEDRLAQSLGGFDLEPSDCAELMHEGRQYYQRYLSLFHLQRYDLVARDTTRNLRLFAFVVAHAGRSRDKVQFDQYRPYVTMMRARALGLQALDLGEHRAALARIDEGIAGIRSFLADYDQSDREAECQELGFLLRWRRQVEDERPLGPVDRLEQQMELAVAQEHFEEAARLRDQIRRLRSAPSPGPDPSPGL